MTPPETQPIVADVLYFHGFADRLDNHGPLFEAWAAAGLRVISFDLPSHGESGGHLDLYSFEDLAKLAARVEAASRRPGDAAAAKRPLLLAGWSTGGLIATRALQSGDWARASDRRPKGLLLFTPAVSVPLLVGEAGFVTERTLTRNPAPPHAGAPQPVSPLKTPLFAAALLKEAGQARVGHLPPGLPLAVFLADDNEDRYTNTVDARVWARLQKGRSGIDAVIRQWPGAYHELDNEPSPVGDEVRAAAVEFALKAAR